MSSPNNEDGYTGDDGQNEQEDQSTDEMDRAYQEGVRNGQDVLNWTEWRLQFDDHLENEDFENARRLCRSTLARPSINKEYNMRQKARVLDAYAFLCDEHLRHPEKAQKLLELALQLDRNLDSAHYHMGSVCSREEIGQQDLAERHYKRALELTPDSAEYHVAYAMLLEEFDGRDNQVQEQYMKALEIEPNHDGAHDGLGRLYMNSRELQNFDLSGHHFRKAIELNANDECSRYNYGLLLKECGNYQEAAYQLYVSLRIDPDDIETRLDYAKVLIGCKRYDDAVDEFLHLIALPNFEGDPKELHDGVRGLLDNELASSSDYYSKYARLLYEQNKEHDGVLRADSAMFSQVVRYASLAKKFNPDDDIAKGLEVYIGPVKTPKAEDKDTSASTTPTTAKSDASGVFFSERSQALVDDLMSRQQLSARNSNASTRRPMDTVRVPVGNISGYLSAEDDPGDDFEAWIYSMYDMYVESEKFTELEKMLESQIQKQRKSENLATIHLFLATVQNDHLQTYKAARENFLAVLRYEPENKEALYALAILARDNLEDYSRAAWYFTKLIGLNEYDVNAHLLLSDLMLQNLSNESGALSHVFKAKKIIDDPDGLHAYITSCKLNSDSEVRQKKIQIYNYCGRLLAKLSHPSQAIDMYWRALDIDHSNSETHILLRNVIHSDQCKDVRTIRMYARFLEEHGRREETLQEAQTYFELADEYERNPPRMSFSEDGRRQSSSNRNASGSTSSSEGAVDEVFSRRNVVTSDDIRELEARKKNGSKTNIEISERYNEDEDFDDVVQRETSDYARENNKSRPERSIETPDPMMELEQKVRSLEQFRQRSSSLLTEKDTQLEALNREMVQMSQDFNLKLEQMKKENEKLQRRLRAKDEEVVSLLNERRQLVDEKSKILEEEKTHRKRLSELEIKSSELQEALIGKEHELSDLHELQTRANELTHGLNSMKEHYESRVEELKGQLAMERVKRENLQRDQRKLEQVNTELTDFLTRSQQECGTQQKQNEMLVLYCEELETSKMRLVHSTDGAMMRLREELEKMRRASHYGVR